MTTQLPVDDATLSAWSALLGLTPQQRTATEDTVLQILRAEHDRKNTSPANIGVAPTWRTGDIAALFLAIGLKEIGAYEEALEVLARACTNTR